MREFWEKVGTVFYWIWQTLKWGFFALLLLVAILIGWLVHDIGVSTVREGDFTFSKYETEARVSIYHGSELAITLPDMVEELPVTAFHAFTDLSGLVEEITLPASVTECSVLGVEAPSLQAYHVVENHPTLREIDGALYSLDGTILYAYPQGRTGVAVIPEGVTRIAEGAFYKSAASEVILPQSLRHIERNTLGDFRVLYVLEIPAGVEEIDENAFAWKIGNDNRWHVRLIVTEGSVAHRFALEHELTIREVRPATGTDAPADAEEPLAPAA